MTQAEFFGPGTWMVFGIILFPVYTMVTAWFVGDERADATLALMGLGYLISFIVSLWGGLAAITYIIGILFYGGIPWPPL